MHALKHRNILRFHAWCAPVPTTQHGLLPLAACRIDRACTWHPRYETSRHLWLVLEYCVGGSLASLLQQDGRLPEDSIHDLARDLVVALQVLPHAPVLATCFSPASGASACPCKPGHAAVCVHAPRSACTARAWCTAT
jgi:serine/threonine protein kinase